MNIGLLFDTVSHLKARQVIYQVWNRVHRPKYKKLEFGCEVARLQLKPACRKYECLRKGSVFSFLNIESEFKGWNDTSHGMLWAYNLNYMDWLGQDGMSLGEGSKWIDKFIDDLPGNQVGLDPYPIALRGINWIKFISAHFDEIDKERLRKWNNSLYSQYQLLTKKLEFHLLGNHILEDAYSIFIASIYFGNEKLYSLSSKLLRQELGRQVLPDGAHFEQSPMYHCIMLDRLLDCCNFSFGNVRFEGQSEFNAFLKDKAVKMLGHLENIAYSDGTIPLLNDSAYGIAPKPSEIKDYARRLGLEWSAIGLNECGYRKFKTERMECIMDVGNMTASYQPGHSHADTFNYELRVDGKPFVVDTGISTYNKTARRQYERGTSAHNTVTPVDGGNSSEVWGGFRVGRRTSVTLETDKPELVVASHDGYGSNRIHRRTFSLEDDKLIVADEFPGEGISRIHFAPGLDITTDGKNSIHAGSVVVKVENAIKIGISEQTVSTEYNRFETSMTAEIIFNGNLKYSFDL